MARRYEPEMRQALAVTREAGLRGNAPMRAVVLGPDGSPIGVGGNEHGLTDDPTAHVEVVTIRCTAGVLDRWRLTGCILMMTLEPCTMCTGTIVAARIDHLAFGAFGDKAEAVAPLFNMLRDPRLSHRPKVTSGVLEADYAVLLEEFFKGRR